MKIIAVIPSRAGSKGLKNKNLFQINGRPLLYYTFKAFQKSNLSSCYILSDSKKIRNLYFIAIDQSIDVIKDFSVSLIFISFSKEKEFRREGKSRKVIRNETNKPKVIIQPKSIIGFIPLNIKERKAQIVVSTV